MKRTISIILGILICVAMIGCENVTTPSETGEGLTDSLSSETAFNTTVVSPWRPEDITEGENPDEEGVSEGRLYFISSAPMLVNTQTGLINLLTLGEGNENIFDVFNTGDYVRVGHGMIMETYPAKVYVTKIALIEDGNKNSFTERELDILLDYATMCSSEEFIEEIMSLKSEKVTSSTNKNGKYDYSQIVIGSGDDLISPVQCYSFEDYINPDSDDSYCADGMGIWEIFEDPNTNIEDLPILVLNGEVEVVSKPSSIQVSSGVSLYTLEYDYIEFDGGFKDLSSLSGGEYLVVFYESSHPDQYTHRGYESLFRLYVPRSGKKPSAWSPEDITENSELDGDAFEGMVSEGRLYFHNNSKTEALLVDSQGSLTWLYSDDKLIFEYFDTGDYVRVGHGMIMETYPAQVYVTKIALIEDGTRNSFTEKELDILLDYATMCSSEKLIEEVMALKSEKVTSSTNENEKYDYSQIVIGSGDATINPIKCFLSEIYTYPETGEGCGVCGNGVLEIFEDPETNIDDIPILVFSGEVWIASMPSKTWIHSNISVYNLEYEKLDFRGGLSDISSLSAGEYFVVIYESSYDQYRESEYESLFRLYMPSSNDDTPIWKPEDITENLELDGDVFEGMVSEGRLYFHNNSKTEALLVDSQGSLTWLYSDDKLIFEYFDTGDYVRVGHGMIMESYPGQTYISRIALVEDGDVNSFTDEEWARLSDVFAEGPER